MFIFAVEIARAQVGRHFDVPQYDAIQTTLLLLIVLSALFEYGH